MKDFLRLVHGNYKKKVNWENELLYWVMSDLVNFLRRGNWGELDVSIVRLMSSFFFLESKLLAGEGNLNT